MSSLRCPLRGHPSLSPSLSKLRFQKMASNSHSQKDTQTAFFGDSTEKAKDASPASQVPRRNTQIRSCHSTRNTCIPLTMNHVSIPSHLPPVTNNVHTCSVLQRFSLLRR